MAYKHINDELSTFGRNSYMNVKQASYGAIAALACAFSASVFAAGTVEADGSSTVYPITEAVAEEFQISRRRPRNGRYFRHRRRLQALLSR